MSNSKNLIGLLALILFLASGLSGEAQTELTLSSSNGADGLVRQTGGVAEMIYSSLLRIGDSDTGRAYRSFASFETSTLPDDASITSARLVLTVTNYKYPWGEEPCISMNTLGTYHVDVKTGFFNDNSTLELADYYAPADVTEGADNTNWNIDNLSAEGILTIHLNSAAMAAIDSTGVTQFRLRVNPETDGDGCSDAVDFYCGGNGGRSPVLIVEYEGGDPPDPTPTPTVNPEYSWLDEEDIRPRGTYYEAVVPDTLDLAQRAEYAVQGLTNFLNDATFAPYGHGYFDRNTPYVSDYFGPGKHNWGKICEALIYARRMSGSDYNLEREVMSIKGMMDHVDTVGCLSQTSRIIIALLALRQQMAEIDPNLEDFLSAQHSKYAARAATDGNYSWYIDDTKDYMGFGYVGAPATHGPALRALARWYLLFENQEDITLSRKIADYQLQPKFWEPETQPSFFSGHDHGRFTGHVHAYVQFLMGLLWFADVSNDARLMQFAADSYEYIRNLGIARIGLLGEVCTTGDMTWVAVKLSEMGVGDYWEDVDQYVRNHLSEAQILDGDRLQAVVDTMPPLEPDHYLADNTDDVLQRNLGAFWSDATHPTKLRENTLIRVICCTGNGFTGLYHAWRGMIQHDQGRAQINLLLNRASPWLDVDSYLPYEGKVVIHNKTVNKLAVRMPRWVDRRSVSCTVNGEEYASTWNSRYIQIYDLSSGDTIEIQFPIVETTETYSLKWKTEEFWWESIRPQQGWTPGNEEFTCTFRGNTLVDISPRDSANGFALYQRDHLKSDSAPMKTKTRFVSDIQQRLSDISGWWIY